jgi:hypothetical protein
MINEVPKYIINYMKNKYFYLIAITILLLTFLNCKKEEPTPVIVKSLSEKVSGIYSGTVIDSITSISVVVIDPTSVSIISPDNKFETFSI